MSLFDGPADHCPTCLRPFLSDEGKVGRTHPSTSRDAAKMPGKRSQAIKALKQIAPRGWANAGQIATVLNLSPNQCATRFGELAEAGLIEQALDETGEPITEPTPMRGRGIVYRPTAAGFEYLRNLDA